MRTCYHHIPIVKQQGFTLLELMLALSLSVVVLLLVTGGLFLVVQDWEHTGNRLEDKIDTSIALVQLEVALHGAFPHTYRDKDENRDYVYFEGEDDRLTWVSTVSPQRTSGLNAWQLKPGKKDLGLEVRVVPAFATAPTKSLKKAPKFILFENFRARFEYLYLNPNLPADNEEARKWLDEWSAKEVQGLPAAVRMTLEQRQGAEKGKKLEMISVIPANQHFRLQPKLNAVDIIF